MMGKERRRVLMMSKAPRRVRRVLMMGKARRRVRHLTMMGKASRREGAQGAQFSRLARDLGPQRQTLGHLLNFYMRSSNTAVPTIKS